MRKKKETLFGNTHLEVQDDGPYEAERELRVAVHDVLGPDVHQLDLSGTKRELDIRVFVSIKTDSVTVHVERVNVM